MMPNVWFCGQRSRATQFGGGWYCKRSAEHEAKTVPDVARAIFQTYFRPGQVIGDPTSGVGTILVEAARAGLDAEGLEVEDRYWDIALENCITARVRTQRFVTQMPGDARIMEYCFSRKDLDGIVMDPPFGSIRQDGGAHRWGAHGALGSYSGEDRLKRKRDEDNLGNLRYPAYLEAMQDVYRSGLEVTKPTGLLVVILRNYRADLEEVDLAGDTKRVAQAAGWKFHQEIIALTSPVQLEGKLPEIRPVVSGPQRQNAKVQSEREGIPQAVYTFNNVLVFKRQDRPKGANLDA